MPNEPITQRIDVDADDALRDLREVSDETENLGDATGRAGDEAKEASGKTSGFGETLRTLIGRTSGLISGIVGINGLVSAYREWTDQIEKTNQHLKETSALVRENAEARLNLVALKGVEDPEEVRALDQAAALAGRRSGEVARVKATLSSQFPKASDEQINALVNEVAAAGQLTDAPLTSLAQPFSALFRETGDPRVAGNILQESITQAGQADPAQLGQVISQFLAVGRQIGGLSAAESAGFAAAGTGIGLPDDVATTGLKNVLFALRGRGTPEGAAILKRLGITQGQEADVIESLIALSQAVQAGRIGGAELEALGGREAAPVFAALSDPEKLGRFLTSVQAVVRSAEREGRISSEKAENLFKPDSIQGLNLLAKQEESKAESVRASSQKAARQDAARSILKRLLQENIASGEITPQLAGRIEAEFDFQLASGDDVQSAIASAEAVVNTSASLRDPISGDLVSYDARDLIGGVSNDARFRGGSDFLEAPLLEQLETGPNVTIDNSVHHHGPEIYHGLDPRFDDLGDREPR